MDYVLDPELAAAATALPKMDLSDLAAARESGQLRFAQKYQTRIPLTVQDVIVAEGQSTAGVLVRVYAAAERSTPAALSSCA